MAMAALCVGCSSDDDENKEKIIAITAELLEQGNGVWETGSVVSKEYGEIKFKNGVMTYASTDDFWHHSGKYTVIGDYSVKFHVDATNQDDTLVFTTSKKGEEITFLLMAKKGQRPYNFMKGIYKKCTDPILLE